jgi:branched-chain amino acid transport system ATP-binding protein
MADTALLELRAASGGYGDNTVLHGVDLAIAPGTWTTIIGANGAGKSTLLKLIAGVVGCRAGQVLFEGRDITTLGAIERLRAGIGLVPQGRCNFPLLPVVENLQLGGYSRRLGRAALARETEAMAEMMAMVLMARPRLLLLDEPSLGLAPGPMQNVFERVRALIREGVTVLMVEQNARQALGHSDVGVVLELGRVSLVEPAHAVLVHPDIRRSFLGR